MTTAMVVALITQVGWPLAAELIEMYHKDPNTNVTPEMWADLKKKREIPFDQLAGPK